MNRRTLLASSAATLAGCSALSQPVPPVVTSDLQLIENGLVAIEAALPSNSPLIATIEADISTVEADIKAAVTAPSATLASTLESLAESVITAFGGGPVVTIAEALLTFLSGLGISLAAPKAVGHSQQMTFAMARAVLGTLPQARR
jgi:hypothetical protein